LGQAPIADLDDRVAGESSVLEWICEKDWRTLVYTTNVLDKRLTIGIFEVEMENEPWPCWTVLVSDVVKVGLFHNGQGLCESKEDIPDVRLWDSLPSPDVSEYYSHIESETY
jgi:hypothetical protein